MKKILSLLLSAVMLTSVLGGISFNALATTNGYTRTSAASYIENTICGTGWNIDGGGAGYDCVDLVYKYFRDLGNYYTIQLGNAYIYANNATLPAGWTRQYRSNGYTPQKGDIACWGTEYSSTGHVALVYAVDSNYIYVVEQASSKNVPAYKKTYSISSPKCFIVPDFPSEEPVGHVMTESEAAGQTIPDGDYWIVSELNQNYFVDLPGSDYNMVNGINVMMHLWGTYATPQEYDAFHFEYLNNGFYKITQRTTNYCLDSQGATLKRSNVDMYYSNNSNAQQWSVIPTARGFRIQARCNSFYLDVQSSAIANETNVQVWDKNESKSQYFGLIPYAPNEKPIKDGVYTISSAVDKTMYLDVPGFPQDYVNDSNIQLWNNDDEKFRLEYAGDGYYRIYENESGLAVEVYNTNEDFLKCQQNVKLYSKNNSRGQFWKIRKNSDGTFTFVSKLSGHCLDLKSGIAQAGQNIHQWYPHNGNEQKWYINVPVSKPAKPTVSVTSKDKAFTVSWTECPAVNKYDKRTYSVSVYQKADNGATKQIASKTGLTDTKYTFTAPVYGNYFVKVTAVNTNYENYKTVSAETAFTVKKFVKKTNPLVAKGKTVTVKYAKVKKKAQTVAQKNAFAVSKAQGKVTYSKASGNKKITVSKAGKITVKKGLKKGTYKVKVKVKAAGNATYKAATKTVTVTIKVK